MGAAKAEVPSKDRVERDDGVVRWIWRGSALLVLLLGWLFILWHNNFHVTPSVVFAFLGYLAGVAGVYAMFRTGATAVAEERETADDVSWGRPLGARGELEREKRVLLKAIKEAEFDLEMGKLSQADAAEMISMYRARAIAVIKELEGRGGRAGSVRDEIEREVRARLELDGKRKGGDKAKKAGGDKAKKAGGDKAKKAGSEKAADKAEDAKADEVKADAKAEDAKADAKAEDAKAEDAKADEVKAEEAKAAKADIEAGADDTAGAKSEPKAEAQEATP